ncbi:hypothetical protein PybrP1_000989 [[Pythium] brassicae (nom. inval.)]|nr:hypothetical protein PybrP1_000989 [[Pythium] brassicae (nom. inval.)]
MATWVRRGKQARDVALKRTGAAQGGQDTLRCLSRLKWANIAGLVGANANERQVGFRLKAGKLSV